MPRSPVRGCRTSHGNDDRRIDRFCEDQLIRSERTEEAYRRYGLRTATGPTYLSIYRDTAKRYPDKDRRQVLLDLIEARGQRGKWFVAAKDEGFHDVALSCAGDFSVEPTTLVRTDSAPRFGHPLCRRRAPAPPS